MVRARRTNQPMGLAFVDVDGLKAVNDSRGHSAGDRLLHDVADALRVQLRDYDVIVRFGGDEFLCSMPGIHQPEAALRMVRVNEVLAASPGGGAISAGLAELEAADTLTTLVLRADRALGGGGAERTDQPRRQPSEALTSEDLMRTFAGH